MRIIRSEAWRAALVAALLIMTAAGQGKQKITFEQAIGQEPGPDFSPHLTSSSWAGDGVHYMVRDDGKPVWVDPATGEKSEPKSDAVQSPPATGRRRQPRPGGGLTEKSADGKFEVNIKDNNLIVTLGEGKEWAATSDGGANVFNGYLDWVYQEEVYGRGTFKAYWWSPTAPQIAFLRLDEAAVKDFTVVDHIPAPLEKDRTVKLETTKYPKAGDPNPTVKLGLADVSTQKISWIDLSGYEPDIIIARVGWTPDGKNVVAQIQNRIQNWLDVVYADPATGKVTKLFRETSPSWVEVIVEPQWLGDGSFLWLSDRTGFRHIYHYAADGKLIGTATQGEWAVRDIVKVDEKQGLIWFTATKDGAVDSNLYRVKLDGSGLRRLTSGRGSHRAALNGDGSFILDTVSTVSDPPEQRLCQGDGTVVKVLSKATVGDIEKYDYANSELVEIPARDGFMLDAIITKPVPFDPAAKYAVWIDTYSGPDAPSVANRWGTQPFTQFLAQQGYISFGLNVRSASGKGLKYTSSCYKQFGVQELQDFEDALAWLGKNSWADVTRVGITGWSYGGFMSAYALTHSDKFALGVAGAGVYDWQLYDTIYTERYMDRPEANKDGYKKSSCLAAAKNLKGHLVLLHGTMDDNVHLQNTIRFIYELEKAGKDFDMMLYPKSRHGVGSMPQHLHMQRLMWRAIQQYLGGPKKG